MPDFLPDATRKGAWVNFRCPECGEGSRTKRPFGVHVRSGRYHCLRCGISGKVDDPENIPALIAKLTPVRVTKKELTRTEVELVDPPSYVARIFEERGLDPKWVIPVYRVRWSHEDACLHWPTSNGFWRRSTAPGARAKVLAPPGTKGLLGAHRLQASQPLHVVVCEGDYAAASIPLPWVGVACGGQVMNDHQMRKIATAEPESLTLFPDGDIQETAVRKNRTIAKRYGLSLTVIRGLTGKDGPDDIPVARRIQMLLEKS